MCSLSSMCVHTAEGAQICLAGCVTSEKASSLSGLLSHPEAEGAVPMDFSQLLLRTPNMPPAATHGWSC